MTDDHAIIEAESVDIQTVDASDDLHPLVRLMSSQGNLTPETIGQLMALQERHAAQVAQQVFNDARAVLLDDLPPVVKKNKAVSFNGMRYTYSDLPQVMRSVMPALRKHGFSISWTNAREGREEIVTCHLSHRGGHSATNTRRGTVEPKKGQSGVQSDQSTVTYLQRHSLLALLGIVTDDMPDADEPPPPSDGVDVKANLDVQSKLRKHGLSIVEAEELVGASCKDWTGHQLAQVNAWARKSLEAK